MKESTVNLLYSKGEDGMMYPQMMISSRKEYDTKGTGKYGQMWKEYMLEKHPQRLEMLIATGRINEKIYQIQEKAELEKEKIFQKLLKENPMPETENLLERAGHMEMLSSMAEELMIENLIYQFH
nr:TnpV protein [uncultured Eisenbergiella sp.]